ncbi:MAG: metalloregulator ArsR/SmtB family transcription factor [Gammaproteobacteria bacterium]
MIAPNAYGALADPTRREILHLLGSEEMSVSALAAHFPVTRPAVSQHLGVLREAGLVDNRKKGRTRYYKTRQEGLTELIDWLAYFDVFWDRKLNALERYLDKR